jgi:vancomycin resistance protein YoaR
MARSYPNGTLSSLATHGMLESLPRLGAWVTSTARSVRNSVLPALDADPPATEEVGEAPATARLPHRVRTLVARRILPALLVMTLLLVIGLVAFRVIYEDRVYPAVVVGDVAVGGLTVPEAQARLTDRAAELERGTVAFTFEGRTWTPTLADLGVTILLEDSIAAAQMLGRDENPTARLAFIGDIIAADQVVPLKIELDQRILDAWYDQVEQEIDQLPVNARVEIENNAVQIVPGASGIVIDREAASAYVFDALSTLEPVAAELPMRVSEPSITAGELAMVQGEIEEMIRKPVVARFGDEAWTIEPETVVPFLDVDVTLEGGSPTAHLTVDTKGLASELRTLYSGEVSRKPVNAILGWDDGVVAVEPSMDGAALRSDAFAREVGESFLSGHEDIEVPVVVIEPTIDDSNLDRLGITTLLGGGHSNFAGGNWERDENVRIATELMNHTLVAPGENFSFNRAIGEITADKGYQEALVVNGEAVGRDVGGGVCQVSTTVFRAALNAGMPIVEWHPHTYRLANYERDGWGPGFDASILQVGPNPDEWADFRFENYTDHWLLVQSYVSDYHVYVNIYGTSDGRSVEINWWENGGNAFGFSRVIYDPKGSVIAERIFESQFK